MANVRVEDLVGKSNPEVARALYKAAGSAIDKTRTGEPTVTVSARALFDLMIAYEDAIEGDTANLEWALAVQAATAKGAVGILEKARDNRWNQGDFDSAAAQAYAEDPYSAILSAEGESKVREFGREAFLQITSKSEE